MRSSINLTVITLITMISFTWTRLNAQWAGSTEPETRQNLSVNNNTSTSKNMAYLGLGLGGATSYEVRTTPYVYSDYLSYGNILSNTAKDYSGINFILGGNFPTSYPKTYVGYELGGGYARQNFDYVTIDNWAGYREASGYIQSIFLGGAVNLKYNFIESRDLDIYVQGLMGYGFISVHDDHSNDLLTNSDLEVKGRLYSGAVLGARFTLLFAEIGYTSTGYFRFGLALSNH